MKLKTSMAKIAGRSSHILLQKLFHRGSTLPGNIALKIDPQLLSNLTEGYEIIVITGTNGKTLTTALTAGILRVAGFEVLTNTSGANMISGIASTFLSAKQNSSVRKFAVLEVDEASLPAITKQLKPSLF